VTLFCHTTTAPILAASFLEEVARIALAIVIAVATTALSLRLLGMRRGWARALVAGALGWGIASFLSLQLSGWDFGADGLILHIVAISIPATMAIAVALDLLARPGSLAIGERAGLVVAPRPLRAIRRRITVLLRYRELVRLVREAGFGPFLTPGGRVQRATIATGPRMRRLLEQAGGVYVKLGQIAATRVDLFPPEVCAELAGLQNRVEPEPLEEMRSVLEAELDGDIDTTFKEFDWEPLAAASIGQTYTARLASGEPVVVKVQRPHIDEIIERDLAALALLAEVAQRRTTFGQGIRSREILDHFAQSLRVELDFRQEADAMEEMSHLLGPSSPVRVPKVYGELCTRRLLVQERFEGFTAADADRLEASGIDRELVGRELLQTTLDQVLRLGLFHADPHPGNVFVFPDGSLGLIDFGAVGRLDPLQQGAVLDILVALTRRDVSLLRDAIERVAEMSDSTSPERLERALARLMAENVRSTGAVQPTALQDLVAMLASFGIRLPADLVILSRAIVTVDGTLRVIAPQLSMVSAANELMASTDRPVIDRDTMVREQLLAALPHLQRLPDRIDRILTQTARGELKVRHIVDEDGRRVLRTLVNRGLMMGVGSAFLVVSSLFLIADKTGPIVSSEVGLFEVFGYGGLLAGSVLLLRVAAEVARDGTT
jgi:ubiquinone biosynthesis protein